jgi:hypothetical protein
MGSAGAAVLDIDPNPAKRREGQDFFGNHMASIEIDEPHETLTVKLAARLTSVNAVRGEPASPAWERVRDQAFGCADIGSRSPVHFLFPSRQVSLDPEIRDYARQSFAPERPVLDGAVELMKRIKADFTYEIGATTVSTMPSMSFALRRGVCQDFAHIMISGLRGLGLPAAYVSGYLRTMQRGDLPRLEGADAMQRRAGSGSIRPTEYSPATITSCWRSAATTPMWRRSTASCSPPAGRISTSRSASFRSADILRCVRLPPSAIAVAATAGNAYAACGRCA